MKRLKKTDLTTHLIEALLDIALLAGLCRLGLRSFFQQFQHPCRCKIRGSYAQPEPDLRSMVPPRHPVSTQSVRSAFHPDQQTEPPLQNYLDENAQLASQPYEWVAFSK